MYKLGTPVADNATGLKGMLVHWQINSNRSEWYSFQPRGVSPETGKPLDLIWLTSDRVVGGIFIDEPVDLPRNILGSKVEDIASGYNGTVTAITLHISGCIHATVQAKGVQKKTGQVIDMVDFDIRRLVGKEIKQMSEKEREKDQKVKPSPVQIKPYTPH